MPTALELSSIPPLPHQRLDDQGNTIADGLGAPPNAWRRPINLVHRAVSDCVSRGKRRLVLIMVCLASALFCIVMTFAPMPIGLLNQQGTVCPRPTVCAEEWYTMALLFISRTSAYFCYPLMVLIFVSKCNNLRTYLQRTWLSLFIPFHDLHALHAAGGWTVAVDVCCHGLAHTLRWASQGNLHFFFTHPTGTSGLISLLLTPLIALPMRSAKLRKSMRWELRKGLHYLSVVWCFSILFHAPDMFIFSILGIPLLMYALDWLYGSLYRTHLIETPMFTRLENAVQLTFANPSSAFEHAGYVLLCVPWLAKSEWHAFSLFRHPSKPAHSCVCISKGGDWTTALHAALRSPTSRPCWVSGPFASPYSTAIDYDNLILVASGIGITPALSIINAHKMTRRINLVWICRDASLLEFFLSTCEFQPHAWTLIYYTGKRQLAVRPRDLPLTVLVLPGRPKLKKIIPEIIEGFEQGVGLPEDVVAEGDAHLEAMRQLDAVMRGISPGDHASASGDLEAGGELTGGELELPPRLRRMLRFVLLLTHSLHLLSERELTELVDDAQAPTDGPTSLLRSAGFSPRGGGGGESSVSAAAAPGPTMALAELCSIISDALPELWGEADVDALLDVIGGDCPAELRVPCGKLQGREAAIDVFAHELLAQLQSEARKNGGDDEEEPYASPGDGRASTRSANNRKSIGTIDEDCEESSSSDYASSLLMTNRQRVSMRRVETEDLPPAGMKSFAIRNRTKSFAVGAKSFARTGSGRALHTHTKKQLMLSAAQTSSSEKQGRNALGILLGKRQSVEVAREQQDRARAMFSPGRRSAESEAGGDAGMLTSLSRLRTWQMLYCGGAQPVVNALEEISRTYGIKLRVEKFDW